MSRAAHAGLVPSYDPAEEAKKLEERKQKESGPVKTSLALEEFVTFEASSSQNRRGKWLSVNGRGEVIVSHEIGKTLPPEAAIELRLNRAGTILVMKESPTGMPARIIYLKDRGMARRIVCHPLKKALLDLEVTLPVRFAATWDEELRAWVGRR